MTDDELDDLFALHRTEIVRLKAELAEARAQIAKLKDQIKMQDVELQRLFKRLQKARRLGPLIGSGETK